MNPLKKMKLSTLRKKVKENLERREAGKSPELHEEIRALFELAEFYAENDGDKDLPHAMILSREAYRVAAILGNSEAQYLCGKGFMEQGQFWDEVAASPLACDMQKTYAQREYDEAFYYLKEAEANGHALAKRLHGLAYVNGWGVDKHTDTGFKMVIESIDMQDAWDKATQIFEELGLNSPDFFAALGAMRKNGE